ncbi:hypothetical protein GFL15_23215 [Rhizobium leguminosarum bv. viciae]|nr:hypothetical protein [Rhizobium leguminosarum bv. viciae]
MTVFPRALSRLCSTLAGVRNDFPIDAYNQRVRCSKPTLRHWVPQRPTTWEAATWSVSMSRLWPVSFTGSKYFCVKVRGCGR